MRDNLLRNIGKNGFRKLFWLKVILLAHNKISTLETGSFNDLPKLLLLDLSSNPLTNLLGNLFAKTINFQISLIRNVSFVVENMKTLEHVHPSVIDTTDYTFCCFSPSTTECTGNNHLPEHISCSNLLPRKTMKFLFASVFIVGFLLAASSSLLHSFPMNLNLIPAFCRTVIAINLNDCLCFVYLSIIWIIDKSNTLVFETERWRTSISCSIAFAIVLNCSVLAQGLLFLLSFSRLMVVIHPLDTEFKSPKFILKCVFLMCVCVALFSFLITLLVKFKQKLLPTSMCSPFINPNLTEEYPR